MTKRGRSRRRRAIARSAGALTVAALLVGGVWGARRLEAYVLSLPEYRQRPNILFTDAPDGLAERLASVIDPISAVPWTNPTLCNRVADALRNSAWVRRVRFVRRYADGSVVASCDYRTPAVLVQLGTDFFLMARDGVRLPGRYSYHPSLVVVQGVAGSPPDVGDPWSGGDAQAGLALFELVRDEPFLDQITGILVDNYGGRRNKRAPHIVLATTPAGTRIVWGSAPGEEIEENSPEQKIALLRENYRRWGRIAAGRECIDISTFPDRFTTRAATSDDRNW